MLETAGGRRELLTTASYQGEPGGPGTYIATDDYLALGVRDEPTLRVYGKADSWRKRQTRAGLVVQAPAIIDFLAALVGVYFAAFGDSGTSAVMVADRGQAVVGWISASNNQGQFRRRAAQASRCFAQLAGQETPKPVVSKISCTADSLPWWRSPNTAAWVTIIVGLLTAAITLIATQGEFGFQQSPGS